MSRAQKQPSTLLLEQAAETLARILIAQIDDELLKRQGKELVIRDKVSNDIISEAIE